MCVCLCVCVCVCVPRRQQCGDSQRERGMGVDGGGERGEMGMEETLFGAMGAQCHVQMMLY